MTKKNNRIYKFFAISRLVLLIIFFISLFVYSNLNKSHIYKISLFDGLTTWGKYLIVSIIAVISLSLLIIINLGAILYVALRPPLKNMDKWIFMFDVFGVVSLFILFAKLNNIDYEKELKTKRFKKTIDIDIELKNLTNIKEKRRVLTDALIDGRITPEKFESTITNLEK